MNLNNLILAVTPLSKRICLGRSNKACNKLKNWRLNDCILYTTLFPCPMCASAIQQARIKKVVYLNNSNNNFAQNISNEILSNKNSNNQVLIEK